MSYLEFLKRVAEELGQLPATAYRFRSWEEGMMAVEWELEYLQEQIRPLGGLASDERWREQIARLVSVLIRLACNPPTIIGIDEGTKAAG